MTRGVVALMDCIDAISFVDKWSDLIKKKAHVYANFAPYGEDDWIQSAYMVAMDAWRFCQNNPTYPFKNKFWELFQDEVERKVPRVAKNKQQAELGEANTLRGFWYPQVGADNQHDELAAASHCDHAQRLAGLMEFLNISVQMLADDLRVNRKTVTRYLLAARSISEEQLLKIFKKYEVNERWWRSGEGVPSSLKPFEGQSFVMPCCEWDLITKTASSCSPPANLYDESFDFSTLSTESCNGSNQSHVVDKIYDALRPYLSPREREVMEQRLGIYDKGLMTTTEVSENLGMHRRVVDINERRALDKLQLLLDTEVIVPSQFFDADEGDVLSVDENWQEVAQRPVISLRKLRSKRAGGE